MTKDSSTVSRRSVLKASAATVVGGGAFATTAAAQQQGNLIAIKQENICSDGTFQVCRVDDEEPAVFIDVSVSPSVGVSKSRPNLPTPPNLPGPSCLTVSLTGIESDQKYTVEVNAERVGNNSTEETLEFDIQCEAPPNGGGQKPPEDPVARDQLDINVEVGDQDLESGDATTSTDINQSNTNVQQGTTISSADSGDSGADSSGGLFSFDF
ncbi:twin-arginine translocation signal domain-containing protein [Natronobacterium lacisalsi]|uniref:twin-arginine translocation signal domain-containing protein n=1 Tax=Natronobacterium lacisalsi TaxID=229731 RepID=UPI0012682796|nr:twin-arginine translocation signal domain-containing protein [Halobiforma lacisalsi]